MATSGIPPPPTTPNKPALYSFKTSDQASEALADFVIKIQHDAIEKRQKFKLAISGGSLPKILGKGLRDKIQSQKAVTSPIQWNHWDVFFADERAVPLDSKDSNYKACQDEFFSSTEIPPENIHPINTDLLDDLNALADDYEQQLIDSFAGKNTVAFPRFDLVLLGMGPDGHTCSLFPGHALLDEGLRWVAAIDDSPKPPPERITLTFPVLNHAYHVVFVATGAGKKEILRTVLDRPEEGLPSSRVVPSQPGRVYWFVDDAASELVKYGRNEFKL